MATYTVQKEMTVWLTVDIEAENFDEAISKAEYNREWTEVEDSQDRTGHYWAQNTNTMDIYYTKETV